MPVKASVSARYNIQLNLEVGWSGQLMSCHGWANAIGLLAENSSPQDTQVGRKHLQHTRTGTRTQAEHVWRKLQMKKNYFENGENKSNFN